MPAVPQLTHQLLKGAGCRQKGYYILLQLYIFYIITHVFPLLLTPELGCRATTQPRPPLLLPRHRRTAGVLRVIWDLGFGTSTNPTLFSLPLSPHLQQAAVQPSFSPETAETGRKGRASAHEASAA